MSCKVQVAVRVRPVNKRELDLGTKCVVDMEEGQTILNPVKDGHNGAGRKTPKTFAFDHCFWSMREGDPKFASQDRVFDALGREILERAFEGYNGCIFAYGQTGSGKSYTMMGTPEQKGIIPRLCDALFEKIAVVTAASLSCKVEVSYMEIYNEKVHDLLDPNGVKQNLKVREHSILGPYVDGLSMCVVSSFEDIDNLMSEGNKSRTVAATNMNSESSRSHAVFSIVLTQTLTDQASGVSGEKVSKLSLVDLAGSERAQKTGAMGERLKEGSNINKSLTTLGLVISALADQSSGAGKNKTKFVPYRDSVLTWLLKDNLGGNSKTVMVATVSPSADNYEETLSTLRYADRAKRIINHAVVNEDPNARIIRELREEVEMLKAQLNEAQSMKAPDLAERLVESEKLMKEMSKTWEEKLQETERIHQVRQKTLEQMGVSVVTSGIKVEHGRPFLVNLNADPSLNELLVYYLKDHTLVGRPDAPTQQDIQLSGLGIQPEHALVDMDNNEVYVTPLDGARTCINGSVIREKHRVRHGDRILWGNNHFFRLNCPRLANSPGNSEPEQKIDYDFAQQELMENELGNDPIQEAIGAIEKQHEEDKQEALEKQRQMYERQMQMLRNQLMSPGTPSFPLQLFDASKLTTTSSQNSIQKKYQQWAQERETMFKQSLVKLREEVVKANALVREANTLAQEMGKLTEFHVTLQIPASNLSPNRRRGAFVSEPAILVKRKNRSSQIWSLEKLENKVIDMREMYEDRKASGGPMMVEESFTEDLDASVISGDVGPPVVGDPFYESQENHNLIGVANIFLECLFHDVKLDYHVPIISQQGEVAGKLHIEISKLGGAVLDRYVDMAADDDYDNAVPMGAPLLIRVCIKEARGLPLALSNFVFCQYSFWGESEPCVVPPEINPDSLRKDDHTVSFVFNHEKHFRVPITEEFIEHCSDGALSIEVWGHRSQGFGKDLVMSDAAQIKSRSVADRWNEVMRKIEFWVEIHELNEQGDYTPVEVTPKPDVPCGGVVQLRQGHSRRVLVRVRPVANSGTLPLICESISSVAIGCVCVRSRLQKGLDSYQEEDLTVLRDHWSKALARRKKYLDEQIQKLINKQDKSEADSDRERALIEQWVCLTEERNAVLVPSPGSNIPGAPADWTPPPNLEEHTPVLFLGLNADDMSAPNAKEGLQAVGINSILPKEHSTDYVPLPIIKCYTDKDNVCAFASWDSSLHDSVHLNRVTPANERVYMILKAVVRLSHPATIELVLRKRVCINIYKKQSLSSFTSMLKNRIVGSDYLYASGVTYEVVSNMPKGSEDLEDMETLAQMAASQNEVSAVDGETYIEKYIKGVSAVESILTLDRLRQEVTVKEMLAHSGRMGFNLRKTTSVPNINQVGYSPGRLSQQFRADSIHDLSHSMNEGSRHNSTTRSPSFPGELFRLRTNSEADESLAALAKVASQQKRHSFGLGFVRNVWQHATPKVLLSPLSTAGKAIMKPMRTLLEEQQSKPLLRPDTDEELDEEDQTGQKTSARRRLDPEADSHSLDSDDFQDYDTRESQQTLKGSRNNPFSITPSSTGDSLAGDTNIKGYTPSMTSSGYGSQAVSTLTLSSEDSASIKSIEENVDIGRLHSNHLNDHISLEQEDKVLDEPDDDNDCESVKDASLVSDEKSLIFSSELNPSVSTFEAALTENFDEQRGQEEGRNQPEEEEEVTAVTDPQTFKKKSAVGRFSQSSNSEGDTDAYSVNAMEELERLCDEDEEDEEDVEVSGTTRATKSEVQNHVVQKPMASSVSLPGDEKSHLSSPSIVVVADSPKDSPQTSGHNHMTSIRVSPILASTQHKGGEKIHLDKGDRTQGDKKTLNNNNNSTSANNNRKKSSGIRPRPMSMVVSPQVDMMSRAWQEGGYCVDRNSSEEHLSVADDAMSECSFGSRADLDRLHEGPVPSWIQEGECVSVHSSKGVSKPGTVRFVGSVQFASGVWIGVDLDLPEGKNDGTVKGVRYFHCRPRHGVFVQPDKLVWDKKRKSSKKGATNPHNRRSLPGLGGSLTNLTSSLGTTTGGSSYMKSTTASSLKKK